MTKGIKVICDECGNVFDSYKINLNKIRRGDGITETFYLCPRCKKRYVVCLNNDETIALQCRINELDRSKNIKRARMLRLKLKAKLDLLNNKGYD